MLFQIIKCTEFSIYCSLHLTLSLFGSRCSTAKKASRNFGDRHSRTFLSYLPTEKDVELEKGVQTFSSSLVSLVLNVVQRTNTNRVENNQTIIFKLR